MRLYFFRHAEAESENLLMPDQDRALTARGIARTHRTADVLKALGIAPAQLYTSPLTRACQTADILGEKLGAAVKERAEVGPGFNSEAAASLIQDLGENDEVMFVGHEPDFGLTVSALIGGGSITMKKGGVARIDVDSSEPLHGSLVWLIAPKLFDER